MATKLTQSVVDKIRHGQEAGAQVYDADVSLRIVIGKKSASYKRRPCSGVNWMVWKIVCVVAVGLSCCLRAFVQVMPDQ